jgi:hypothetical protein
MTRLHSFLAAVTASATFACGSGDRSAAAAADTTARNLTLAPAETTAQLRDVPAASAASKAAPRLRPTADRPARSRPAAPATLSLPAGTRFELAVGDTISSRTANVGDVFTATVFEDVRGADGRVVVPAGSVARGRIADVKAAPNPNETGTLTLEVSAITVRGADYPIALSVDSLETVHKGRGIQGRDAAKVGAGAAAGAVLGRVIGKDKKGTVIGGAVGAAVGAGVAAATKDVDIVLPKGAHIVVRLTTGLTVRAS